MKVLHIHFGKEGGAERFFVNLLNGLAERGVEQKAVIRPGRLWKSQIPASVGIRESNFRDASIDRVLLPLYVRRLVRTWRPDAVLGWMPRAAKLIPGNIASRRLARLGDYPASLKSFGNIETLICNAPDIARHVAGLGWKGGVEIISNFTDMQRVQPIGREALDTPDDAFVISAVGRFAQRKGMDLAVRALAERPGAYLWLVGEGSQEANLRELSRELGVQDRVRFAGWQKDPRPYVAASNCFLLPSLHEPLGNVVLEAWAQQVPVVSTRSEGPSWFMQDGENGLLVDIGDVAGAARAIGRIQEDTALAARLIEGGNRTLEQQFSQDAVVQSYMKLFSSGAL